VTCSRGNYTGNTNLNGEPMTGGRSIKMTKSAERNIEAYINEHEEVVKIDSNIYSQGEGSDSPECF
jgi:hypothetical protein